MITFTVNNIPENLKKYIVARYDEVTKALWFWGTYEDKERAEGIAREIGGVVGKYRRG